MKKLVAQILSFAVLLNLCIPVFATSQSIEWDVGTTYSYDENGNEYKSVKSIEPDGGYKSVVSGINGVAESIRYNNIVYFSWTANDGTFSEWSVDLTSSTKNYIDASDEINSTRAIQEIEGLEWGFYCRANDGKEDSIGINWTLHSEEGKVIGADQNNSTYRSYAESFWNDIISMNASIRSAKASMSRYGNETINMVAALLSGTAAVGEIIRSALDAAQCDYESTLDWQTAREYANQANYYFLRYKNAVT